MPTYVYECSDCECRLELEQKITDEYRPSCEKCEKEMFRVIQASIFVLNGSGWAKDGYK